MRTLFDVFLLSLCVAVLLAIATSYEGEPVVRDNSSTNKTCNVCVNIFSSYFEINCSVPLYDRTITTCSISYKIEDKRHCGHTISLATLRDKNIRYAVLAKE